MFLPGRSAARRTQLAPTVRLTKVSQSCRRPLDAAAMSADAGIMVYIYIYMYIYRNIHSICIYIYII